MFGFEVKKEFSNELEALIPVSITVATEKGIDEAISLIFALEKKCRVNNDFKNLKEVCLHAIRLCKDKQDWLKLNSVLALINKRNAQSKTTITAVVNEALTYVDATPTIDTKIELIKALKDVCEGKIYVEAESARLHLMLSKIYEGRGDITAASDIVQDVHVETYGSLSKREKAEYILEQMRLTLLKKDYIRTLIHSRKMNLNTIEEKGFEDIKFKFYTEMIEYHTMDKSTWENCLAYHKIASIPEIEGSPLSKTDRMIALESCILFLLMSKYDNHQNDLMHRISKQLVNDFKSITINPTFATALNFFMTPEIIATPMTIQFNLESHPALQKVGKLSPDLIDTFTKQLEVRIIEHNLRVIAKYYKRIKATRLCELVGLTNPEFERHLSELASDGDNYIKIDRPAQIISFQEPKRPESILSDWSSDISKMLHLVESTCHLINREIMVYKV